MCTVTCEIDNQVKVKAEKIFNQCGVDIADVIKALFEKTVENKRIPFNLGNDNKLPIRKPIAFGALTDKEINELFEQRLNSAEAGNVISLEESRRQVLKGFGL